MSKYGFDELQMLYEDGFRGDAVNRNTNYDYGGYNDRGLSAEFPALRGIKSEPLKVPTGDYYDGENEEEVTIPKNHLKKKISELIDDAADRGMGYAVDHLHSLLTFADSYKK
jgi:hypothetical protein